MVVCNLASGSTGNCTYVETEKYKILIDIGKNKKYIYQKLSEIGINAEDIDYIFLTHTHDDHTSALKTFLKNHKAKLVVTSKMVKELKEPQNYNLLIYENDPQIEGLDIHSFIMSHDTNDTRAFIITDRNVSLVYITDTGYINSHYLDKFKDKDIYFIECNHDIEMLTHGPYPSWLKKRVLSDSGHLSNRFTGMYLSKLIGEKTKDVLLIHLSETNNREEIALGTVYEFLKDNKINSVNIKCAKPNEKSDVIKI